MSNEDLGDRDEHGLGRHRGRARDVHAGGLRVPRGRPDPHEERRPHRGEERPDLRDRVDRLLLRRLRDRVRRRRQRVRGAARASLPSIDELLAVGAAPFSWFTAIPGAAGYLFEVVFCGVSLAIVWGAMAERTKLWVYFAFGAIFTLIYSLVSHWIWSPDGWLFAQGHAGLRRLDGRALPGRARRSRRCAAARAAHRQDRQGRQVERDPRAQHGVHDARRDHPLVRLVRLQPGLDAERRLRRRRLLRLRRAEHEPRGRGRRARRRRHLVARDQEARPLDDAERRDRGARRDHRRVRVRRAVGGDPDRLRRRRDRRPRRPRSSTGSGSTIPSARSPRTACPASGARSRSAS